MATVFEKMTQLANAIRSKTGGTAKLSLDGMIAAVNGLTIGSGADIEALGELCDYEVIMDQNSTPVVIVYNYHPSYYLHCEIETSMDGTVTHIVVEPNGSATWMEPDSEFAHSETIYIDNIRWSSSVNG